MSYRNFWAMNVDEAVVTGILRNYFSKNNLEMEVSMPLNSQLKGIDLFAINLENKKSVALQVKGSRAYEPNKKELQRFHDGSAGWFFPTKKSIFETNANYFIFLNSVIEEKTEKGRRDIKPHIVTIPTSRLQSMCGEFKSVHGGNKYSFYFWINPRENKALEYRDKEYDLSDYLDEKGLVKLANDLK